MNKISLLLVFMSTFLSFSQSEFQGEIDLGYAFQSEAMLNNESVDNTNSFGMRLGVNYLKMLDDRIYIEIGLFGKFNRSKRKIETLEFTSNSLKMQFPLYVGYKINDIWRFSLGASVENNKDFDDFDFKRKDNLRYDFLTKLIYVYNDKIQFSFYTNWMLTITPDVHTIHNPKNGMFLGVIYQFSNSSTIKTKEN